VKRDNLKNSLFVSAVNVGFAAIAFVLFIFPRFTNIGGKICLLILLLAVVDIVLVLRDLFTSGTRGRAIVAVLLWLPVVFLFGMIMQWEGPLYVAASGDPPVFQARGLAGVCGVDIYGPEQEKAEWYDDDIGLLWSINHTVRFPFETTFKYGEVPSGFTQVTPAGMLPAPPLAPDVTYKVVVGRCMGLPQYLSLHGNVISEYKPIADVCWGELKVAERQSPAWVRVDCNTHHPLPMSTRAAERLKKYRENRIPFY
jgi:hypothetical protein